MHIAFFEPFSRAWNRMTRALFKPFNLRTWMVVGFTAFLANLLEGGNGGKGGGGSDGGDFDLYDFAHFPITACNWLLDHPLYMLLILFGLFFLFILFFVLTWLGSRGKFMFLDNVVHSRALVAQPWREYGRLGDSLFLWRILVGLVVMVLIVIMVAHFFTFLINLYEEDFSPPTPILFFIQMGLLLLALILLASFVSMLTTDFVVPIMYRERISVWAAWSRFLPLLMQNLLYFLLYSLLIFLFFIVIVITVILFGLFTCCLGFLLLAIPYIKDVVTLPISYTLRAFSVEFLAQFGPQYVIFPAPEEKPVKRSRPGTKR